MRSSLLVAEAIPHNADGEPLADCHVVKTLTDGRLAIHAHQSVEIPSGVEVIRNGHEARWSWADLYATHPAVALELLGPAPGTPPHYWTDDPQPSPE